MNIVSKVNCLILESWRTQSEKRFKKRLDLWKHYILGEKLHTSLDKICQEKHKVWWIQLVPIAESKLPNADRVEYRE